MLELPFAAFTAMWVIALPIAPIRSMRVSVCAKRLSTCCWYWVKVSFQAANFWSVYDFAEARVCVAVVWV